MEQVRDVLRLKHYSLRTERSYCDWIERFIRFHQLRHPKEMGEAEVSSFLTQPGATTKNRDRLYRIRRVDAVLRDYSCVAITGYSRVVAMSFESPEDLP